MIRIKRKNLIISGLFIVVSLVLLVIGLMFIFDKKLEINISKEQINEIIQKELPLNKEIDIKKTIPVGLEKYSDKIENPNIIIKSVNTEFKNDVIHINSIADIILKDKTYIIYINTSGRPIYKKGSFYFEADSIKITTEKSFSEMFKDQIEINNTVSAVENKVVNLFKNKLNIKENIDLEDKKNELLNKIFNKETENKLNIFVEIQVEKFIKTLLVKQPLYTLKDSYRDSSIRIGLDNVFITDNGLQIIISIQQIIIFGLIVLFILILFIVFLYYVIKNPSDVLFGIFEVSVDVISAVGEATIDVV